ncbi:MAG TPA: hypothetical protein VGP05_21015 [Pseudonocardia sp.]|jgi:hypothetical protein|nr:hypothetical protein [Pseudonocardia sp.]
MGMLGELFPGKKLGDEGGEDSDGKLHRPRFDIDLDSGVVRMPTLAARKPAEEPAAARKPAEEPAEDTQEQPDQD